MITRRDITVALLAMGTTLGMVAVAQHKAPVMRSSVFDWNLIPARPTQIGSVRPFFKTPTATLNELELHVTTLNPGKAAHPPHKHPNEELIIVQQGTVETLSGGEWKRVGPGSVIFNGSNELHCLKNVGSSPATYHVISWTSADTPRAETP